MDRHHAPHRAQAGSDVGALKTKAERQGDHYLIRGQKIFITWGEHDCAENIVHMVLRPHRRCPGRHQGHQPLPGAQVPARRRGQAGRRNDLRCVSLEQKLGIHASPTAVMAFGDNEGAVGYLIGGECLGMAAMFTMMNNARLSVGMQGVAIAERAYQQALAYARERRQGRALDAAPDEKGPQNNGPVPIIRHPDVRRMLATMKAKTEAVRALAFFAAAAMDRAIASPDAAERAAAERRFALLTPLVKACCSDTGCQVADLGVQVHGGMGFIEETGAAQHYRDARILPIYEGTNGIQALDLLTRKILRDGGAEARLLHGEIAADIAALRACDLPALEAARPSLVAGLEAALSAQEDATDWLLARDRADLTLAAAGASPYCQLFGNLLGGWLLAKSALAAAGQLAPEENNDEAADRPFLEAKIKTAAFYAANLLPHCAALAQAVIQGAPSCMALEGEEF